MDAPFGRVIVYTKKPDEMIRFYGNLFGYVPLRLEGDRIIELRPAEGGFSILLHPASKGQREGQSLVKLVFDVEDVAGFCQRAAKGGHDFGPIHKADGYVFANTKDPSKNPVSVSSRAFRSGNQ